MSKTKMIDHVDLDASLIDPVKNSIPLDIRMIVAMDQNLLIGSGNDLPWHLPLDLQLFKAKTLYQHILMGYNTFESIIKRAGKPLPNRFHWVLTRKNIADLAKYENVFYLSDVSDIQERISYLINQMNQINHSKKKQNHPYLPEQLWVIGGSQIYDLLKNSSSVSEMHITHIHKKFEGDAYFKMSSEDWQSWQVIEEKSLLDAYKSSDHYQKQASQTALFSTLMKHSNTSFVNASTPENPKESISPFKLNMHLTENNLSADEQQTTVKIYQRLIIKS